MPTRISEDTRARVAVAWPDILSRVAAGERYSDLCAAHDLTYDQMRGYRDSTEGARAEWDDARKDSANALVDRLVETISSPDVDPARARVTLDTLKFLIERLDPERFAPRSKHDVSVTHKVKLAPLIEAARERVRLHRMTVHALPAPTLMPAGEDGVTLAELV
jgi:hypothetical protein